MDFPPLYKEKRVWNINVVDNRIVRSYGIEGGKLQVKESAGTTAIAHKLWDAQKNKGYKERVKEVFSHMLSHPFNIFQRQLSNKVYIQPKFDSIRVYIKRNDRRNIEIYRQNGTQIKGLTKIHKTMESVLTTSDFIIDGELYNPDMSFDQLYDAIDGDKSDDIRLYVYDCFIYTSPLSSYAMRRGLLYIMFSGTYMETDNIDVVDDMYKRKEKIKKKFDHCALSKWEGVVIRDPKCIYTPGKRSKTMLELKHVKKREYEIINHKLDECGNVVWICETPMGKCFDVKPHIQPSSNFDEKGQLVSIKYKNYTDTGTPRDPTSYNLRKKHVT